MRTSPNTRTATLNGPSGSATLKFKIDAAKSACESVPVGAYGVSVPDLGESYGTAVPVDAVKGFEWPHFYYGARQINPQLTAASQWWYGAYFVAL